MITEEQRLVRKNGIGGSDWWHLLGDGCHRRLWYDKIEAEPDFPDVEGVPQRRGNRLERVAAGECATENGWKLRAVNRTLRDGVMIGHADMEIVKHADGPGVLEVKVPMYQGYKKIAEEGARISHLAQVQHYLMLMRRDWGALYVFSPERWEGMTIIVDADTAMQAQMREIGAMFWGYVERNEAPPRLDCTDSRCKQCPFFSTCQGAHLLGLRAARDDKAEIESAPELTALHEAVRSARAEASAAEKRKVEAEKQLKEALGDRLAVLTDAGKITYHVSERAGHTVAPSISRTLRV